MFNGFGSPIRGSVVSLEMHRLSPADANCFERTRDRLLAAMAAAEFQLAIAAAVLGIGLVCALLGVIVLFFPLNFGVALGGLERTTVDACNESLYNASWIVTAGTTTFPPRVDHPSVPTLTKWTTTGTGGKYVAYYCTPVQWWFNVLVKYLSFYFGYVNLLPVPWTFAILVHAFFNRPGFNDGRAHDGLDFYGRVTESLWFHLPLVDRKTIAMLNLLALLLQIPDCIFHMVFWQYLEIQLWPGILLTNLPLVGQLSMQLAAAVCALPTESNPSSSGSAPSLTTAAWPSTGS